MFFVVVLGDLGVGVDVLLFHMKPLVYNAFPPITLLLFQEKGLYSFM